GEHRNAAGVDHARHRSDECIPRHDDFVSGLEAKTKKPGDQRRCSAVDRKAMGHSQLPLEKPFELKHLWRLGAVVLVEPVATDLARLQYIQHLPTFLLSPKEMSGTGHDLSLSANESSMLLSAL